MVAHIGAMKKFWVTYGQKISPHKLNLAKRLRRRMTREEHTLWGCLRAHRLNGLHFRRQQVIDGFIADFYCTEAGLVVEVDGKHHEQQRDYDAYRDSVIRARGLRVLRFPAWQVRTNLQGVLDRIREFCPSAQHKT